ncbi:MULTISPECIES: GntR family transcriptional regulator [Bordetella]|uniref:GntR family transcriptional regulator n=2 Tax=Bordetella TaxID=517 RepID=A0A261VZD9_9BORD|nr:MULTISPECIES: GntR family transcriptional regulator [Bordetella]MDM9559738.1 GntR family transcriptional regulator [Bordetella petrii]OZI79369.1 GntR family transcriptional regulator [Bordetella genomosp. 2]
MERLTTRTAQAFSPATPIADRISRQLRDDIIGGRLPPGTQLVEVDLSAKYEASRNTIREVLHQLGREGLATFVRHKGVVVRRMQSSELRDIYAARRALELHAISRGRPLDAAALDAMRTTLDMAERALAGKRWRDVGTLSLQIHQQIVAMLGSPLLDDFFQTLCAQLRLVFASHPDESQIQTSDWIRREKRIYQYLGKDNRAGALRELETYLDLSERTLLNVVEQYNQ